MARKNRVVVPDGTYHVTSRIAGRAHLLEDPAFKDDIVECDFTGTVPVSIHFTYA